MTPGTRYTVTVRDVMDTSGNTIWPNPSYTTFYVHPPLPFPSGFRAFLAGSKLIVEWANLLAVLQSSSNVRGPWEDLPDATSPAVFETRPNYCNPLPYYSHRFFRLRHD